MQSCRIPLIAIVIGLLAANEARSAPDVSGKIVLANLDRYDAYLRVGKTRREIKPKKASVLAPRTYPATIAFWSGNTKSGWRQQTITKAGIYGFNFKHGRWSLTELKRPASRQPAAVSPSPTAVVRPSNTTIVRHPSVNRPSDEDWKEIDTADEKDWGDARADLGDLISDAEWDNVTTDFAEIDTDDFWQDNLDVDLGDVGIVDNVEPDELDPDDGFSDYSLDLGDGGDLVEGYDVGDFDIDDTNYDLGGYDDFGGYDGAFDVNTNDFGGGYFGDDEFGDFGGFDDFDF